MLTRRNQTRVLAAVALASALGLSACGEGIALEGKLFDYMGISSSALEARSNDPKLADRPPLVVPPNTSRLPEPGSGKTTSDELAALKDPEERKRLAASERERLHMAYCRGEIQWKEKAFDANKGGLTRSPYGPCPSLFGSALDNTTK